MSSVFLVCDSLEDSASFYQNLGFQCAKKSSRSYVFLTGSKVELHLHERLTPSEREQFGVTWSSGSSGLVQAYEVDDLAELVARVPSQNKLMGPVQTPWGSTIAIVQDPDQNRLEFRQRKTEPEFG